MSANAVAGTGTRTEPCQLNAGAIEDKVTTGGVAGFDERLALTEAVTPMMVIVPSKSIGILRIVPVSSAEAAMTSSIENVKCTTSPDTETAQSKGLRSPPDNPVACTPVNVRS